MNINIFNETLSFKLVIDDYYKKIKKYNIIKKRKREKYINTYLDIVYNHIYCNYISIDILLSLCIFLESSGLTQNNDFELIKIKKINDEGLVDIYISDSLRLTVFKNNTIIIYYSYNNFTYSSETKIIKEDDNKPEYKYIIRMTYLYIYKTLEYYILH